MSCHFLASSGERLRERHAGLLEFAALRRDQIGVDLGHVLFILDLGVHQDRLLLRGQAVELLQVDVVKVVCDGQKASPRANFVTSCTPMS